MDDATYIAQLTTATQIKRRYYFIVLLSIRLLFHFAVSVVWYIFVHVIVWGGRTKRDAS